MASQALGAEWQLTIIFGSLATVLAAASVVLTCLQYRHHARPISTSTTPSSLEDGISPAAPDSLPLQQNEDTPRWRQIGLTHLVILRAARIL